MARHPDSAASDALEEIESFGERIAGWVGANPIPVLVGVALVLGVAGGYGGYVAWSSGREDRASVALAAVQRGYLEAMGATPGAVEIPEPANPATAAAARRDAVDKLLALSREHGGTTAALMASMEAGDLLVELGDRDRAIEVWQGIVDRPADGSALRGLLLVRIAQAHEAAGRWSEAGESYARAGDVEGYPLRAWALADAARAFAEAGDAARAQTLAVRVGTEPGAAALPERMVSELAELRAAGPGPAPAASPPSAEAARNP